ncbi:hypothetical protein SAMN06265338_10830 [Rhodoblastus acidophilus]|uniref:Uncharacterized protein n=1 Tax=Rhodoblastus acidophilus TaxID=1074 RepID=A0A212RVQ6_RHOAC|nr:hypothetical protein [Rhodoblastus acidophilus]SNB76840.1 hypothetical protein SAMN06265338_10830 [Rhodoblastus acidophilus]
MNDLVRLSQALAARPNWRKAAAPAGAALLLVALGWGVGAKIDSLRGPSPEKIAAQAAAQEAEKAKKDVAALRVHVDTLNGKLEAQAEKARDSEAAVAALQKSLADEKAQSQALHAKLDKMQPAAPPAKDNAGREASAKEAEKESAKPAPVVSHALPKPPARMVDPLPTASTAPTAPKAMAAKPQTPTPKPYRGYVLRDIGGGVAMIEGEDGVEEVAPGDRLAGGARVQRFERRGAAWVVVTDRGYIGADGRWDY